METNLKQLFNAAQQRFRKAGAVHHKERVQRLKQLKKLLIENQQPLIDAISQDFGHRSSHETLMLGLIPSVSAIHYHMRRVKKWMKPKKRRVPWYMQLGKARIHSEPKGVVGIIVPWNYPLQLAISPLVSAIAAGNHCLVKVSEFSPHFGELFAQLIERYFPNREITVINGDADVSHAFSELPFDHLFFTGSSHVGKLIMRAASDNLTPVTLELGGKSPVIISQHYPLKKAVDTIIHCKLLNAGQTCVAPDYLFLPEDKLDEFISLSKKAIAAYYPALLSNPDYSTLLMQKSGERVTSLLHEIKQRGHDIVELVEKGGGAKFSPCLVINPDRDTGVMQQELFAPILPVITYRDEKEILPQLHSQQKPLAFYYFGRNNAAIKHWLAQTQSGGAVINGCLLHAAINDLPFGGVGHSGMGSYHAKEGFLTFSHQRSVFYQGRFNAFQLLRPPYRGWKNTLIKLLLRLV